MKGGLLRHLRIGMMIIRQGSLIIQQEHLVHFRQEQVITVLEHLLRTKEGTQVTHLYQHRLTNPDISVRLLDRIVIIIL